MDTEQFKVEYWKRYNTCYSEEDFANLLAWIYFQVEGENYYEELPYHAAVAKVWDNCPSAVNKFIEHGGPALPALMISTVISKVVNMTTDELVELDNKIKVDNLILLN